MAKPPNNNEIPSVSWSGSPERGQDSGELPQVKAYEIIKKLGEGGMGIVYLAEQKEPIKRQVALKIIKPGMDSAKVIARFEAERQTLALLDHPSIARVFDAGTTKLGRPYFAMEYVKGIPITEYCDFKKLSIEERLQLLMQVCQAIQHAHQKGIIHRDIKPSNILVYADNGRAIPKVIDFGVAKALSQQLTERTMFTEEGQLIGTPEYMSPEQTDLASHDIDTRTDIYSLGVLLYELLTGVLPFDPKALRQAAFEEIQRIIREQDPPRPSTKLSSLGEEAEEIVQKRQTELPALIKRLYKELEWIPLKAMRKERSYRYQSASELAEDIQNYLNGSPLIAGPESKVYQIKKFVRRNRVLVTSIIAIAFVLIAGIVVSTIFGVQANQQRQVAERERDRATQAEKNANERTEALRRASYFTTISLAKSEYDREKFSRVHYLLSGCPPDLRGWEWNRLWHLTHHEMYSFRARGLSWGFASLDISPDGRRILSVSGEPPHESILFDSQKENSTKTFDGYAALSPDGKYVATSKNSRLRVYNIDEGRDKYDLRTTSGLSGGQLWFSKNGDYIILHPFAWLQAAIVHFDSGKEVLGLSVPSGASEGTIDISQNSRYLVTIVSEGNMHLWDLQSKCIIDRLSSANPWSHLQSVSFGPDDKKIFFLEHHQENRAHKMLLKTWDVSTKELETMLELAVDRAGLSEQIKFSPDGRYCLITSEIGRCVVYDIPYNNIVSQEEYHEVLFGTEGNMFGLKFNPTNTELWNVLDKQLVHKIRSTGTYNRRSAFSYASQCFAVGSQSDILEWQSEILLWHLPSILNHNDVMINKDDGLYVKDIRKVIFMPDRKTVASLSDEGEIHLWNFRTGSLLTASKGFHKDCYFIGINPQHTFIAMYDGEKCIVSPFPFYDEAKILEIKIARIPSIPLAFFVDQNEVFIGDGTKLSLWNLKTRHNMSSCELPSRDLTYCFNDRYLFGYRDYHDNLIRVWDIDKTERGFVIGNGRNFAVHEDKDRLRTGIHYAEISPNGEYLVSRSDDGSIKIWEIDSRKLITTIPMKGDPTFSRIFVSPSSNYVGMIDGRIRLWDIQSGKEKRINISHSETISSFDSFEFSQDEEYVAVACLGHTIAVLDVSIGESVEISAGSISPYGLRHTKSAISLSTTGEYLLGANGHTITLWDPKTLTPFRSFQNLYGISRLCFGPDDTFFATVSEGRDVGVIAIWNIEGKKEVIKIVHGLVEAQDILIDAAGKSLILKGWDGAKHRIQVWDIDQKNKILDTERFDGIVKTYVVNGQRKTLFFFEEYPELVLYDYEKNNVYLKLPLPKDKKTNIRNVVLSPNGRYLIASMYKKLVTWNTIDRKICWIKGGAGYVKTIDVCPNNTRIVSTSGNVKVWDIQSGAEAFTIDDVDYAPTSALFCNNGASIAAINHRGTVKIWDSATQEEVNAELQTNGIATEISQ